LTIICSPDYTSMHMLRVSFHICLFSLIIFSFLLSLPGSFKLFEAELSIAIGVDGIEDFIKLLPLLFSDFRQIVLLDEGFEAIFSFFLGDLIVTSGKLLFDPFLDVIFHLIGKFHVSLRSHHTFDLKESFLTSLLRLPGSSKLTNAELSIAVGVDFIEDCFKLLPLLFSDVRQIVLLDEGFEALLSFFLGDLLVTSGKLILNPFLDVIFHLIGNFHVSLRFHHIFDLKESFFTFLLRLPGRFKLTEAELSIAVGVDFIEDCFKLLPLLFGDFRQIVLLDEGFESLLSFFLGDLLVTSGKLFLNPFLNFILLLIGKINVSLGFRH